MPTRKITHLRYNRALFVFERGDFEAMEADFKTVLNADPEHADSLNALGYMLAERNERLDEARSLIEEALRLRPAAPHKSHSRECRCIDSANSSRRLATYRMGD